MTKQANIDLVNKDTMTIKRDEFPRTFDDFDQLSLKSFYTNLKNHSVAECSYIEGSFVLSLNSKFGSGKSCFFEMMKKELEKEQYNVIHINAWKNDFFDEPIITIASEIIDYLNNQKSSNNDVIKKLKDTLVTVIGSAAISSNQIIDRVTGINIKDTAEKIEKEINDRNEKMGHKIFKDYVEKSNLFIQLNESLDKYLSSLKNKPLFILVDELDRTRPDYAVNFLETLKHFFQTKGIVFILGVDKSQLESSVRCLYGDLEFSEYYRKFIHRNVNLPEPNESLNDKYIKQKVTEYFKENKHYAYKIKEPDKKQISTLCCCFNLSLRQINELFRILSYVLTTTKNKEGKYAIFISAVFYIVIYLHDEDNAAKIKNNKFQLEDYINLFKNVGLIEKEYDSGLWLVTIILFLIKDNENTYLVNKKYFLEYFYKKESEEKRSAIFHDIENRNKELIDHRYKSLMAEISKRVDSCLTFFD
tara:strand:- start:68 stop:1489 length:1422 start_codon:yes stop_codon:yes gene_type:complete